MDEKAVLKEIIALEGTNMSEIADKLGYSHPSGVINIFQRKSMRVDILIKVLDVLDCDLIIRSRKPVKAPGGSEYVPEWTVRGGEDEGE